MPSVDGLTKRYLKLRGQPWFIGIRFHPWGRWWKIRNDKANHEVYSDRHDPTAIVWRFLGLRITGLK